MGSQRGGASVTKAQSQQADKAFASYVSTKVPQFDFESLLLADLEEQFVTPITTPTAETETDNA